MLPRLIGYIFWLPAVFGLGSLFLIPLRRRIEIPRDETNLFILTVGGIAILGTIANITNYFIPTGTMVPTLALLAGWILLVANRRAIARWIIPAERSKILLFGIVYVTSIVVTAYYSQRGLLNIDVGGYHFPAVKWTTNSVLPLGLANVNPWFGYNYLWFQAAAMMEVIPTGNYSAFILNGLLLSVFTMVVWYTLATGLRGRYIPSNIFMTACVLAWAVIFFFAPKEVYSFTPNLPVAVIAIFSVYVILRALEQEQYRSYYLYIEIVLVTVTILIKISSVAIALSSVVILLFWWKQVGLAVLKIEIRKIAALIVPVLLLLIVPWIPRGIMTSGCLVYPISVSCVQSLPWARSSEAVQREYAVVQSIARVMNSFAVPDYNAQTWPNDIRLWLPYWLKWNRQHEPRLLLSLLFMVAGLLLWIITLLRSRTEIKSGQTPFIVASIPAIVGVVIWFVTAPLVNYGYGWLLALGILFICSALMRFQTVYGGLEVHSALVGKLALLILIVVITGKVGKDVLNRRADILLHWPDIPNAEYMTRTTLDGVIYYLPNPGTQCWDAPIMCSTNENMTVRVDSSGTIREIDTPR